MHVRSPRRGGGGCRAAVHLKRDMRIQTSSWMTDYCEIERFEMRMLVSRTLSPLSAEIRLISAREGEEQQYLRSRLTR